MKVTWSDIPALILVLFSFFGTWIGVQESVFKKEKKGVLGMQGNTTVFSMLSA